MGVYNVWDYEMNLEIKTVSNWHDGSFCLLKDGKVKNHIIGERVVHDKHLNNNGSKTFKNIHNKIFAKKKSRLINVNLFGNKLLYYKVK